MMGGTVDRLDMSGQWDGVFTYPDRAGATTPFLARIEEAHGTLTGTLAEPHEFASGSANATLSGYRSGMSVDFTKSYHGAGPQYAEPVVYAGRLSADGLTVTGSWMMQDWAGTFEMHRDETSSEMAEWEETVSIPVG